jgi:flagellar protein FlgJ
MLNVQNADVYTDFNGLANLKNQAKKDSPEALKEVAKQFESIFLNNILKSMRAAKLADGAMDNEQSKFYNEMYDQQLSVHLSGSVGLADLIVKQMSPHKPDNPKSMVQNIEDYQNKFGGLPQTDSGQGNTVVNWHAGGQAMIAPYLPMQNSGPLNQMTELPAQAKPALKNSNVMPIQSAEDFVSQLHPYAEQAAKELGVEPKVILAQAALETGWGRSVIKNGNGSSSFNLFNIKADKVWQGKLAKVTTLEFDQGVAKKVNAGFRSYDSFEESFRDYVSLIKSNPRYGDALKKAGNAQQYMQELQQAGYATDPKYADKVMSIYQGNTMAGFEPDVIVALNQ